MSAIIWTIGAGALVAALVLLVRWRVHASRVAARSRLRVAAWDAFIASAPSPPSRPRGADEDVYSLCPPPGPEGEVVVWEEGLTLRLASYLGREVWIPWGEVMRLEAEAGGVQVRLKNGLRVHVSILGERSLYHAKSMSVRGRSVLPKDMPHALPPGSVPTAAAPNRPVAPMIAPVVSPVALERESERWSAIWSESDDPLGGDAWPQGEIDTPRFGDPVDGEE